VSKEYFDPLATIQKQFTELLALRGIQVLTAFFQPTPEGGRFTVTVAIDPLYDPASQLDVEWEAFLEGQEATTKAEKKETLREALQQLQDEIQTPEQEIQTPEQDDK
jgi:glucose-6-phosphate isomerase